MTRRGGFNFPFLRRKSSSSYSINKDSAKVDNSAARHSTSSFNCNPMNDVSLDSGIIDSFYHSTLAKFKASSVSTGSLIYGKSCKDAAPRSTSKKSTCKLFKTPLRQLCCGDKLPEPIWNMLRHLYLNGPFTVGIFRKSANARLVKELQVQLEADPLVSLQDTSVIVVGSVFKEFLRSLPNCLLDSRLYGKWMEIASKIEKASSTSESTGDHASSPSPSSSSTNNEFSRFVDSEILSSVKDLLNQLPYEHDLLLQHLLCLLWHITLRQSENKMCSSNLAVCIGPSLLNDIPFFEGSCKSSVKKGHSISLITLPVTIGKSSSKNTGKVIANAVDINSICKEEISNFVPKIISFLIDHCIELYGERIITLLGSELIREMRPDSAIEVEVTSDSLNSLNSAIDASSNSPLHRQTPPSASSPSVSASTCDSGTNAGCTTSSSSSTSGESTGGHSGSDYFSSNNSHSGLRGDLPLSTLSSINNVSSSESHFADSTQFSASSGSHCESPASDKPTSEPATEMPAVASLLSPASPLDQETAHLSNSSRIYSSASSSHATISANDASFHRTNCNDNSPDAAGNGGGKRKGLRSLPLSHLTSGDTFDRIAPLMPSARVASAESLNVSSNHSNVLATRGIANTCSSSSRACSSFDICTPIESQTLPADQSSGHNSYFIAKPSPSHFACRCGHSDADTANCPLPCCHIALETRARDVSTASLLPDEIDYYNADPSSQYSLYMYGRYGHRYMSHSALVDHLYSPYACNTGHLAHSSSLPYYHNQAASLMALNHIPSAFSHSLHNQQVSSSRLQVSDQVDGSLDTSGHMYHERYVDTPIKSSSHLHLPSSPPHVSGMKASAYEANQHQHTDHRCSRPSAAFLIGHKNNLSPQHSMCPQNQSTISHMPHPSMARVTSAHPEAHLMDSPYHKSGADHSHHWTRSPGSYARDGRFNELAMHANANYFCDTVDAAARCNENISSTPLGPRSFSESRPFTSRLVATQRPQRQLQYGMSKKIALQSANLRSLDAHHCISSTATMPRCLVSSANDNEKRSATLAGAKEKCKNKSLSGSSVLSKSSGKLAALSSLLSFAFRSNSRRNGASGEKDTSSDKRSSRLHASHPCLSDSSEETRLQGPVDAARTSAGHQLVPSKMTGKVHIASATSALPYGAGGNSCSPASAGDRWMTRATSGLPRASTASTPDETSAASGAHVSISLGKSKSMSQDALANGFTGNKRVTGRQLSPPSYQETMWRKELIYSQRYSNSLSLTNASCSTLSSISSSNSSLSRTPSAIITAHNVFSRRLPASSNCAPSQTCPVQRNSDSSSISTIAKADVIPQAVFEASLDKYRAHLVSESNVTLRAVPIRISSRSEGEEDNCCDGNGDSLEESKEITREEGHEKRLEKSCPPHNLLMMSKASSVSSTFGDESNGSSIYISELDSNCSTPGADSIRSSPCLTDDTCCSSTSSSRASASHMQVSSQNNKKHKNSSHSCRRRHQSTISAPLTGRVSDENEDDKKKRCTQRHVTSSQSSVTSGVRSDSSNSNSSSADGKAFTQSTTMMKMMKNEEKNVLMSASNLNLSKSQHTALVESCFRCSSHNLLWHECFHEKL